MRLPLLATLMLMLALSACGGLRESRLNPFNWFGRSQPIAPVTLITSVEQADPRPLVQQVLTMSVEPMQGGVIVRATGVPPTQGWWSGELVARDLDEQGRLIYDFRIVPPPTATRVSTQFSREVTVADFISNQKLEEISQIIVQGELNARSSGR
jgi:hypothetical protein